MLTLNRSYLVTSVHQINVRQEKYWAWALDANKRTAQVKATSLLFGDIIYLYVFKFHHSNSSHFFRSSQTNLPELHP